MNININNLIIEITRKCNLRCDHCLRGDIQNIDINYKYIDSLFKQIDQIRILSISGGEPALVPHIINYIIKSAKKYNVEISNYYLATNGTIATDDFILSLINIYLYCSDNGVTSVNISNDEYHDVDLFTLNNNIEKLSCLTFVRTMYNDIRNYQYNIIAQGRAEVNFDGIGLEVYEPEVSKNNDELYIEGEIYLNCFGQIINSCNLSYDNQNKHIICDVDDFKNSMLKRLKLEAI